MQRKPGFPHTSCNIKIPDNVPHQSETTLVDDDPEQKRRLQLINFGHTQWGFTNWSWAVSKQDLDFVDNAGGKYSAGVVAFVSVTVKSLAIHRENIGYATTTAPMKGSAIYQARKGAVTNALRETLLSFGGSVTTELLELLETQKTAENIPAVPPVTTVTTVVPPAPHPPETNQENNQNIPNKPTEPKNVTKNSFHPKKDSVESAGNPTRTPLPAPKNPPAPPVAKALPMPANLPPANKPVPAFPANQPRPPCPPCPPCPRPNSNECQKAAPSFEGMTEEEARAERKRRQRQAQEEFRQKQIMKQKSDADADRSRLERRGSFDSILLQLPSQDVVIEESGQPADGHPGQSTDSKPGGSGQAGRPADGKRRSPEPAVGGGAKRLTLTKLDILTD